MTEIATLPAYDPPTASLVHEVIAACIDVIREHGVSPMEAARAVVSWEEYCRIDAEAAADMAAYAQAHGEMPEPASVNPLFNPVRLAKAVREAVGL